jgi:hypothetical protein
MSARAIPAAPKATIAEADLMKDDLSIDFSYRDVLINCVYAVAGRPRRDFSKDEKKNLKETPVSLRKGKSHIRP